MSINSMDSLAHLELASAAPFSRSTGLPSHMGKATESLKCLVPFCVKEDFARLAHVLGMTEGELLREWVILRLYGEEGVKRMHEQRLRMVAGIGPESQPAAALAAPQASEVPTP